MKEKKVSITWYLILKYKKLIKKKQKIEIIIVKI